MVKDIQSGEDSQDPKNVRPTKTEWNRNLDDRWVNLKSMPVGDRTHTFGEGGRFRIKGRCRRCWGGLVAKGDPDGPPAAIRCRVCDILLEGDDAKEEDQGMSDEISSNIFNMAFGEPTKYRDGGRFVNKVFPHIDRKPEDELRQRITAEASKPAREGWLTRSGFPPGSPGFLVLQAKALVSAMERLPREVSAARFPDVDLHDDGSVTVHWPTEELTEHPSTSEYELMKRLGSALTIAMMSAFACELTMKAIRLTREDNARKSHDLWRLYRDLPADSKARIEADFPDVVSVVKRTRHTFGQWRYFEANVGARGMSAMIDTERAFALAKTARVLLDEAEMMGLGYSVNLKARQRTTKIDDQRQHIHVIHDLDISATEAPPR